MSLIRREQGKLVALGKKHQGTLIEELCQTDPKYVTWLYDPKRSSDLPDDVYDELKDLMKKYAVPFERRRRRRS